jgi:uncharacterized lipoprotein YddW (UPF0748 family)
MRLKPLLPILLLSAVTLHAQTSVPPPARELRGSWIATVHNINWPIEPGLPVAKQKEQLVTLIDSAANVGLNALIFQVRPAGDAMYASQIEPWSPFLTGQMGVAPSPLWDPLEFAVTEAHKRGMELHAWFNPFRALAGEKRVPSADHIVRKHPEWTMKYGPDTWMDPGVPEVRAQAIAVMHGRDAALRCGWHSHRRLFLSLSAHRCEQSRRSSFPMTRRFGRYKATGGPWSSRRGAAERG